MPYRTFETVGMTVGANQGRKIKKCPVPRGSLRGTARQQGLRDGPHLRIIPRPGSGTGDTEEAPQHPNYVCVEHSRALAKGLRAHRLSNIPPDPWKRHQRLPTCRYGSAVVPYQGCSDTAKALCPVVESQRGKQSREVLEVGCGQRLQGRPVVYQSEIHRDHFGRACLLEKDFSQQNMVRISCLAPRELAGVLPKPGAEPRPKV